MPVGHHDVDCCMLPPKLCVYLLPRSHSPILRPNFATKKFEPYIFIDQFRPAFYFTTLPDTSFPPVGPALCLPAIFSRPFSSRYFLPPYFFPHFISPRCPIPHSRQFVPPFVFAPFSPALSLPAIFSRHISSRLFFASRAIKAVAQSG